MDQTLWTIGHSNREIAAFIELLTSAGIELVADVRRFPGSRRHPQFGQEALAEALSRVGLEYQHFPALGGRRSTRAENSPNTAWRVEAFNAYADYMQTDDFKAAAAQLATLAGAHRTAIMCSEALPWRCHRRLIADAMVAQGWTVLDIIGPRSVREHALPEFARVAAGAVTYPGGMLF
ncbi:MAG: DNA repair protein [Planctomycetota bacterium]|nr:MAG: DNA repair protein [Planctomycetota bacterium]